MRLLICVDRKTINDFLENHDCPTAYSGYEQLVDVIFLGYEYFGRLSQSLKTVYYDTARIYGTTRQCLERNLRTLTAGWAKRHGFQKLFTFVPTNAQMIARIIEKLYKSQRRDNFSAYDILLA
jgi:hypothetical protein